MHNPFRYFNSSPEVIRLAVMMYIRCPLSLRQVEDLLFERGIDICHETVVNLVHELLGGGEAAPSAPDDLTAIRGIGIATQNRLYKAGIKSHGQLARATPEDV